MIFCTNHKGMSPVGGKTYQQLVCFFGSKTDGKTPLKVTWNLKNPGLEDDFLLKSDDFFLV